MELQYEGFSGFADFLSCMIQIFYAYPLSTNLNILDASVCLLCPSCELLIRDVIYLSSDLFYSCSHI